jgi:multidrug efflux pump subunit AcrA (membrane-fusion protein)
MKFRDQALNAQQSSDVLDLPVRLTSPRGWIVVTAMALVIAGGGVWAFTGRLPRTVDAVGLLTSPKGSFAIQTIVAGQVTEVMVEANKTVSADSPVARVFDGKKSRVIRAPQSGRVYAVRARVGQVLPVGGTLAVAERNGSTMVAALYATVTQTSFIRPGVAVQLKVASAADYGVLLGRVSSIDSAPATPADIVAYLGDEELGMTLAQSGARYRVVVTLDPSSLTPSGYLWSYKSGPPSRIQSRTGVVGAISLPPVRPADWILPS